jgi:hypothetical protein
MSSSQGVAATKGMSIKTILILIAIVVLIVAAIYIAGRKAGKSGAWSLRDFGSVRRNVNPSEIPNGWSADPLAKKLYDVMDGVFTFDSTKNDAYSQLVALTDSQVREVYLAFNQLPGVKKPDTLTTWINEEWSNDAPRIAALARLQQLNLP